MKYPYAKPRLTDYQKQLMLGTMESPQQLRGKYTEVLEDLYKEQGFIGVFVNSGSSANLIAALAFREYAKEVLLPPVAFPTTAFPFLQGKDEWDIDIYEYDSMFPFKDTAKPKGLELYVTADLLGFPTYSGHTKALFDLVDCCDDLEPPETVLANADAFTMSFHPAHQTSGVGGGIAYFRSQNVAEIARSYAMWGRACTCRVCTPECPLRYADGWDRRYQYDRLGYNLLGAEIQAAAAVGALMRGNVSLKRKINYAMLEEHPRQSKRVHVVPLQPYMSPFGTVYRLDDPALSIGGVLEALGRRGIESRPLFAGRTELLLGWNNYPHGESADERYFFITCHEAYSEEEMEAIGNLLYDVIENLHE